MKKLFIFFFLSFALHAEEDYQFVGKHLIISYLDCHPAAIHDEQAIKEKMKEAANASGVTILSSSDYQFTPSGMTQVLLLSESHASIHTYPEFNACFVDLFTCGESFAMDEFDRIMSEYLKPQKSSHKLLLRNEDCQEIAYESPTISSMP